jgi:hypothetical protein
LHLDFKVFVGQITILFICWFVSSLFLRRGTTIVAEGI